MHYSSLHENTTKVRITSSGANYAKPHPNRNPNVYSNYQQQQQNPQPVTNLLNVSQNNNKSKIIVSNNSSDDKHANEINTPNVCSVSSSSVTSHKLPKNNEVNYTNLQLALKAATAALEKSKITASTVYSKTGESSAGGNSNSNKSQSQCNLTNLLSAATPHAKSNHLLMTASTSTNSLNSNGQPTQHAHSGLGNSK